MCILVMTLEGHSGRGRVEVLVKHPQLSIKNIFIIFFEKIVDIDLGVCYIYTIRWMGGKSQVKLQEDKVMVDAKRGVDFKGMLDEDRLEMYNRISGTEHMSVMTGVSYIMEVEDHERFLEGADANGSFEVELENLVTRMRELGVTHLNIGVLLDPNKE